MNPVSLEFEGQLDWDITALSKDWAALVCQNNRKLNISKIGVMSSLRLQQMMSPWISENLSNHFRLLMYTSSIIYNQGPRASYTRFALGNFYAVRSLFGAKVLAGLEKIDAAGRARQGYKGENQCYIPLAFWYDFSSSL
jgi:hypothetical protein